MTALCSVSSVHVPDTILDCNCNNDSNCSDEEAAPRAAKEKEKKRKHKKHKKKRRDRSAAASDDEAPRKKHRRCGHRVLEHRTQANAPACLTDEIPLCFHASHPCPVSSNHMLGITCVLQCGPECRNKTPSRDHAASPYAW